MHMYTLTYIQSLSLSETLCGYVQSETLKAISMLVPKAPLWMYTLNLSLLLMDLTS